MLAQYSGSDSGAAALGIIIALALIGLQIYLIYAIIATRQDVRAIRGLLGGGGGPTGQLRSTGPWQADYSIHEVVFLKERVGVCLHDDCDFETTDRGLARLHEQSGGTEGWTDDDDYKACPDCAEEVRADARKCRFCGYMFADSIPSAT